MGKKLMEYFRYRRAQVPTRGADTREGRKTRWTSRRRTKNEFMKPAGVTLIVRLGVFGIRPPGNSFCFHPCSRIKLISPAVKKAGGSVLSAKRDRILINVWHRWHGASPPNDETLTRIDMCTAPILGHFFLKKEVTISCNRVKWKYRK